MLKISKFHAEHYFYRVEFQQRGPPHIHCLLWLKESEGDGNRAELPPNLWVDDSDETTCKQSIGERIASFASSVISGSIYDAHCLVHTSFDVNCSDCQEVRRRVTKFQKHNHTFTCKKKKGRTWKKGKSEGE